MNPSEILNLAFARPSVLVLVNLILLSTWFPVAIYGITKRNYPWFLFGIALFLLFSYNWILFGLGIEVFSEFKFNIFFELLFLYSFFFLYLRIYEEREALGLSSNLFHSHAPRSTNWKDFLYLQFDVFSALGGVVFFTSLYMLITITESAAVVAMFTFLYFLTMYFRVEKKCFYLEKDYAYFGSLWTQGQVLRSFRLFSRATALIFGFYLVMAFGHFFEFWNFEEAFTAYQDVFFLVETFTVLLLIFFTLQLFTTKHKLQKQQELTKKNYSHWLQQIFTGYEQVTPETHPQFYYSLPKNPADYGMLHILSNVLSKSQSDLVYLKTENHEEKGKEQPWPELCLVGSKDSIDTIKKKPLFDLINFDLEYYFPGLAALVERKLSLFFPNIEERSFAFRRHFGKIVKSHPDYNLKSLIIFPFSQGKRSATLILINPQFDHKHAFQPLESTFLTLITTALGKINFAKLTTLKRVTLNQILTSDTDPTDKKNSAKKSLANTVIEADPKKDHRASSEPSSGNAPLEFTEILKDENDDSESTANSFDASDSYFEDSEQIENDADKIFAPKKNRKKFIAEAQQESVFREQIEKVHAMFSPAKVRENDCIEYHIHNLFEDRIPNSIALATNLEKPGKLFAFNEFKQSPAQIASSTLSLKNLFYEYLQEKDIKSFIKDWYKGFKAFSNNDACYTLAMQFEPEDRILSYYNMGVKNAYVYDCANEIFSPLRVHQNKVLGNNKTKEIDKKKPIRLDLQVGDFIIVFSSGMKEIKNRSGKKLEDKFLFNLIKKNQHGSSKELMNALIDEIKKFSFSLPYFRQTFFIAKVTI